MPSSNFPDRDKIPDMSLGERNDHITAKPPIEVTSSIQPQSETPKPAVEKETPAPPPPNWGIGDDVFAPWEPFFLYAGTIKSIKVDEDRGDQALIDFDDGGEGWVFLYLLCPLELKPGQEIECRRGDGSFFSPGEVVEVADGEVQVHFEGGGTEWTTFSAIRVPCVENGPGAIAVKFAPFQAQQPQPGASTGMPQWIIWVGIAVLLTLVRIGCREMARH